MRFRSGYDLLLRMMLYFHWKVYCFGGNKAYLSFSTKKVSAFVIDLFDYQQNYILSHCTRTDVIF